MPSVMDLLGPGSDSAARHRPCWRAALRTSVIALLLLGVCVLLSGCGGGVSAPTNTTTTSTTTLLPITSIRVAKALGSRGYDKVRVSLIREASSTGDGGSLTAEGQVQWSYESQFKYRWTKYHLSSAVVSVVPGQNTTLSLGGGREVQVRIPAEGRGSVGVLIGDPCINYDPHYCVYGKVFETKTTLQKTLNALAAHGELDYWMMVGDLFYDQSGELTRDFFSGLQPSTLSSLHGATLGNHDYWIGGSPEQAKKADSFGYGHAQWYAQDTMAANGTQLFHFINDPDKGQILDHSNTFWYHKVGNVAFVGFSNAYSWEELGPYFQEACNWAQGSKPALVVLLGHWNGGGMGCAAGMDTPSAYSRVRNIDACRALGSRLKWVEGHKHCNQILVPNTGFLLGSFGFEDGDARCHGAFAIPILDTRGGRARLYYYELGKSGKRTDNFDTIMSCLMEHGHSGCTQYADKWMDEPLEQYGVQEDASSEIVV